MSTALIALIPVKQSKPYSPPKIGANHFLGEAIPIISVAKNNNHGFIKFVAKALPIPTEAMNPTLKPNATEAISERFIRFSKYSGITGLIPSWKTAIPMCDINDVSAHNAITDKALIRLISIITISLIYYLMHQSKLELYH